MIDHIQSYVVPAAYALLPPSMAHPRATAMLLATGLQVSKFRDRRPLEGTACGFWGFEKPNVREVITNPHTRLTVETALRVLRYEAMIDSVANIQQLLVDNDTLACVFARSLLLTLPTQLPRRNQRDLGWRQFAQAWNPADPAEFTWPHYFAEAWDRVAKARADGHPIDDDEDGSSDSR